MNWKNDKRNTLLNILNMYTKLIGKGREAEVYMMDEKRILKLFFQNVPNNIVQREVIISKELNNYSLPIPKYFGTLDQGTRKGLIYEYIQGELLINSMIKNPFKLNQYILQFVSTHKTLHKISHAKIPRLEDKLRSDIQKQILINPHKVEKLIIKVETLCQNERNLLHWDYHPANIIVYQGEYKVIDWTGASLGPRIADVARTYMLFKYSYIDSISLILNKLVEPIKHKLAKMYLASYLESKEELDLVKAWLPIIAIARLSEGIGNFEKDRLVKLINL